MEQTFVEDQFTWQQVVDKYIRFITASRELEDSIKALRNEGVRLIGSLRKALPPPEIDRYAALYVLEQLPVSERLKLFPELVYLASWTNGFLETVRSLILSLPRDWVLANVEKIAEPLMQQGTDDEYRRFLELYEQLDRNLARKLASKAEQNSNADIQEAGREFFQRLSVDTK